MFEKEIRTLNDTLSTSGLVSEIGLVALGGSHAYGLATDTSDVDLRGFALPCASDVLALSDFEQVLIDKDVDACIYSLIKTCRLLLDCNPNVIELLGLDPSSILVSSDAYKELASHPEWFVSKKAAYTFGGYATAQLRRIQNAMSRDEGAKGVADSAMRSMQAARDAFPKRYRAYQSGDISITLDESAPEKPQVLVNMHLDGYPAHELRAMADELSAACKRADQIGKNRRKSDAKLSKHASHLLRLLYMGQEILTEGIVRTHRTHDRQILLDIKQGKYLIEQPDGSRAFDQTFWDMLDEAEAHFSEAKANSSLPEAGNSEAVMDFVRRHHKKIVMA